MILVACLLLAPLALAEPTWGNPDPRSRAREIYEIGKRAFRVGDLPTAAARFKESYQLYPAPLLLFNLGHVHQQLNDPEQAKFFFQQFLVSAKPTDPDREEATKRLDEVERTLRERREAAERAAAAEAAAKLAAQTPTQELVAPRPVVRRPSRGLVVGGAVALSLGVLGVAVGATGAALAVNASSDLSALNDARGTFDPSRENEGKRMQTMGIVGFAIGGAALVTGAVLLGVGLKGRAQ